MGGWGHVRGRISIQKLRDVLARAPNVERVPCVRALTPRELAVAVLLHEGLSQAAIGLELGIAELTVRYFVNQAAEKIPGDLVLSARVVAWLRGASLVVLGADRAPETPLSNQRGHTV